MTEEYIPIDFDIPEDKTQRLIKVIGVGGGGCNAVKNMYNEGISSVSFAICNTDSQSLVHSNVPVKILLGTGLGAGGVPEKGKSEAEQNIEDIKRLLSDGTKMVFVTAGMGGGTGTGAGPVVAGVAKSMGILTIGIVTIPFYFEKKRKIIKAIKGVEQMRKNVDALLIINNERLCDVYSDSPLPIKEAFKRADNILLNATKSISELITVEGDINLDFRDVENTLRSGGSAIMAMGRAKGEHRVENAIVSALDSPLLYGSDISQAKRILVNIYTSNDKPLLVEEMNEIDAFMDTLDVNIDVIWGTSTDDSLGEDAKVTILATGLDKSNLHEADEQTEELSEHYDEIISQLYKPVRRKSSTFEETIESPTTKETPAEPKETEPEFIVEPTVIPEPAVKVVLPEQEPAEPEPAGRPSFLDRLKARMRQLTSEMLEGGEE